VLASFLPKAACYKSARRTQAISTLADYKASVQSGRVGQGYMVEVQGAYNRHAVIRRQDDLCVNARIVRVTGTTMISFK